MRKISSLNDGWTFVKNAADAAAACAGQGEEVTLPHTWNAVDGQDGGNDYYRGTCWYVRRLSGPAPEDGGRVYLEINGAAMTAGVYLNGVLLARHEGGYSTFRADLTEALREENELAVSVDNSANDAVYPQKADFTFYGGLYRDVNLIVVPAVHFALDLFGGPGIRITPAVNPDARTAEVTVETWVSGALDGCVKITVGGVTQDAKIMDGKAQTVFHMENVRLWDGTEEPYLYTVTAALESGDEISARFGCRSIRIDPQKGFLLNGRSYPLRGVSRHQDRKGVGNALTPRMHREDMDIVLELGANALRLAHYQHAQEFLDLCDENGIVVWAEIPYITMHMNRGTENTLSQMEELIWQCANHPSIAVWGLSNEITAAGQVDEELLENHRRLNGLCHKLDPARPTAMANVFMLETDSPILEIPDVNSYNLYFGWYLGELGQNDEFFDEFHGRYPDRCIGFSEYGADANPQYQSPSPERGDYTEGYQTLYHEHILDMIEQRPWLWSAFVWNLFDFGADGRDEGGKHGENQKGLVTFDRKTRKDAFYLYKAHWSREPFVHVCGSRYVNRAEEVTEVKVYSNQPEVALYVDGALHERQTGRYVFRFQVPVCGLHTVEARAACGSSAISIRRVDAPDPDYIFNRQSDVVNWFDREDFDPGCYSVSDTLGELGRNPEAGALVQRLMARAASSRGDVAESVKDNPALQRMMQRLTLISMLKQAGEVIGEEDIKQLNSALQKIKKTE